MSGLALAQGANLGARFLLELCALGALGYWGFRSGGGASWLLGVGAPLLAAVVWGAFASPKAAVRVPAYVRTALQAWVSGCSAAALAAAGHPRIAAGFVTASVANWILMAIWEQ